MTMFRKSVLCRISLVLSLMFILISCSSKTSNSNNATSLRVNRERVLLVQRTGNVGYFFWSPDGTKLIYVICWMTDGCQQQDVMLVDLKEAEKNAKKVNAQGPIDCGPWVKWSFDSKKILILNRGGIAFRSYLFDIETNTQEQLPVPENWVTFYEDYSPVANMIVCNAVYVKKGDKVGEVLDVHPWRLATIDLDKNQFKFIPTNTAAQGEPFLAHWSLDGKNIGYCASKFGIESGKGKCYSLNLSTGEVYIPNYYDNSSESTHRSSYEYRSLGVWEKEGIEILGKYGQRNGKYYGAWAFKMDGSGKMWRLTDSLEGEAPSFYYKEVFSPDLRFVADVYVKEGRTYFRIRELKTGKQKLLDAYLQLPDEKCPIAWSPDGKSVCYLAKDSNSIYPVIMLATIEE